MTGADPAYHEACRTAATAQGLDPIMARLTAEGIRHHIENTGGFVMLVVVPLRDQSWIGVTASDRVPRAWLVVFYDDQDTDTVLADAQAIDCPPDQAVSVIREHLEPRGRSPRAQLPRPPRRPSIGPELS